MRVLLDECVPVLLGRALTGHDVVTVRQIEWLGLKNGTLLRQAAEEFDVFLTIGQGILYQQAVPEAITLVTLHAVSNRLDHLLELIPALLDALEACVPGTSVNIPL